MYELLIGVLLTWRITSLINAEAGPFDMFGKFRDLMGLGFDEYNRPTYKHEAARMIACFWCASIWVGLFVSLVMAQPWWLCFVYSSGAIMINTYVGAYHG